MWAREASWWKCFESEWEWCQLGGRVSKGIPGRENLTCKELAPGTRPLRGTSSSWTLQRTSREVQELGWRGRLGWRWMSLCNVKWEDLGLQRQTWWRAKKHKEWFHPYVAGAWGNGGGLHGDCKSKRRHRYEEKMLVGTSTRSHLYTSNWDVWVWKTGEMSEPEAQRVPPATLRPQERPPTAGGLGTTSETDGKVREVTQSCPTLCDHMDCSLPGSSAHGIFQARVLEWVAISTTLLKAKLLSVYSVILGCIELHPKQTGNFRSKGDFKTEIGYDYSSQHSLTVKFIH